MLSGFFVTKKGKNLLAKTHDGANIELTRAEIGSGDIPEGQLVTEVTSLYGKVKELPLGEVKVGSGKEVCIPVQLTNKGVLTSFLFKEIGVYAIDPDEGEILYLYGNTDVTGDVPDEVKSESESQVDYLFNLLLNIDNTTKVDVNVDNSLIYATLQNLSDMADTKVDKVSGKGLSTEDYTTAEKNKLAGIEAGANKYVHPSSHPMSMITGLDSALDGKVDKVNGKGLSTEDYTTAEKNKLAGIAAGANKYVHPSTHPVGMITGLGTAATENTGTSSGNVPVIESNGKLPAVIIPSDDGKQDKLTFDTSPKSGSTNPVTSAGIYTALAGKANSKHNQGHDTITFNPEANKAEGVFPLDRGYVDAAGACRTAFMPADAITVEYTQDNGVTWNPYSLTDIQKQGLFSMNRGCSVKLGGPNATAQTIGHGVRITVSPTDNRYALVDMLYCWFLETGVTCKCNIERSTIGAKTTFATIRSDVPVSGNSGPNSITFAAGSFGGSADQTSNFYSYRFTFMTTAIHPTITSVPTVTDLRLYGDRVWRIPNQMMFNGHLYSWDANQNATFPAQLNAAGGTLTGELVPNGGLAHAGTDGYIAYPDGGQYVSSISSVTGMLKITLPVSWNWTMLKFKVSIYNYVDGTSVDYIIVGYNHGDKHEWFKPDAYCVSPWGGTMSNLPVSFGHDGTKCAIAIGTPTTTWQYPQVTVSDVTLGYIGTSYDMWKSGWSLSFVTEVLPTVNATISNTNITYNLDANNLRAGLVPPERLSPDPGAYAINPVLGPSDVLHTSLEQPTLAAIGAVDSTFTNKIAFYPYENALCEISSNDGATWTPDPGMAEAKWKALVSENNNADISFTSNKQYRITLTAKAYCYLSAVYFYANVASKVGLAIKVEKWSNDAANWSVVTPQTNANDAQPRHFWLQHANVPFNPKTGNSVYCGKVRITFIPSESDNATGNVRLYGLRWYGGYPGSDHRTIYSWDEDKNVTFPAQLKASEVYDNNQRVYSPVNKPSAADLGAATISHTHNLATTAESGYMSDADKTKLEATNIAYGTCATAAATAAKVVTLSGNTNWKLVPGSTVTVKFTYTNTASNPTLNVAGTGAKPIWVNTAVITTSNLAYAGSASRPIKYVYNGTQYVCMGWSGDNNSTYALMTAAEATTGTATNAKLISAKVLHDKIEEMLSESLSGSGTGQTWHAKDILGSGTTSTADATAESGYSVTIDTTAKNIDGSAKKYKAPFGTYVAIFRVQASTVTGSADKIKLEIWGTSAAIASRAVKLSDFSVASKWEYFKIPFETDSTSGRDIYPKVTCLNATGNVKVDNIVVVPNAFALM